jgi:hypothetical protein
MTNYNLRIKLKTSTFLKESRTKIDNQKHKDQTLKKKKKKHM